MTRFFTIIFLLTLPFTSFSGPVKVKLVANNQVDVNVRVVTLSLSIPATNNADDNHASVNQKNDIVEKILSHLGKNKNLGEFSFDGATSSFTLICNNSINVDQLISEINNLIVVKEEKK